jgi:riboflavin transporter FmnP
VDFLLIPDVRYANEAELIREVGTLIIKGGAGTLTGDAANHISEQLQVKADFVVINDKDLDHLHGEAQRILKTIQESKSD